VCSVSLLLHLVASLWAYLWMVVALSFITVDVVDLWEAVFTFIHLKLTTSRSQRSCWTSPRQSTRSTSRVAHAS
jgi:type III secretory pathway component EscU